MNPRVLIVVIMCVIAAVCAYLFTGLGSTESKQVSGEQSEAAQDVRRSSGVGLKEDKDSKTDGKTGGKKGKVDWDFFAKLANGAGTLVPKEGDISRFLAKHGETPANLVAAFESTTDRRWLERALELFPKSPLVLMKAVEVTGNKPAPKDAETHEANGEKLSLIERFKAADPNNPVPWILAAQELFKSKQTAEGVSEIRSALERPAFYVYLNERTDAKQRLYESMGLGQTESSALATFGITLPHMGAAQQASRGLLEWQKSAVETGDAAASDEALRLTYSLGRTFSTPEASRLLIGQLIGNAIEKRALDSLPADVQPDWLPVDRAQRLAEIEKQKQLTQEFGDNADWLLKSKDEEMLAEWIRRVRIDGEMSAMKWLKAQKK